MYFDFSELEGRSVYKLMTAVVVPRPIAWVVSRNANGTLNAAPFSFFGLMSGEPPVITIGVGARDGKAKDTHRNLQQGTEFVVNLVSTYLLGEMNLTAIDFAPDTNELDVAGLETAPSIRVGVPRIARSPVAMECKVMQVLDIGAHRKIVVAAVKGVHIRDEAVLDADRCYIDSPRLDLVARMHGGGGYSVAHQVIQVPRISVEQWQVEHAPSST